MLELAARSQLKRAYIAVAGVAGISAIGAFDYVSGTELRVYPFYWGPVALLAWHFGRSGAVVAAVLASVSWFAFNRLAGMQFSSAALWMGNAAVHGVSFLLVGILISTLHEALATARALSRADPLTGLRNSRAFHEDAALLMALCRRTGHALTLAYVDLDNFKAANDRYGHQTGDAVLRGVAEAIRATVRPSDIAARLGGDEFAVMLVGLGEHDAKAVLERLRSNMNKAAASLVEVCVTVSIGGVTLTAGSADLESLVQRADALMYNAKASGRNMVELRVAGDAALERDRSAATRM